MGDDAKASNASPPAIVAAKGDFYLWRDNQTLGPADEQTVRVWIAAGKVTPHHLIWAPETNEWFPIAASQFGAQLREKLEVERIAATTCPQCAGPMVAVVKTSGFWLLLLFIGVALTPVCIGIPILIFAFALPKTKTRWTCPRCKYTAM